MAKEFKITSTRLSDLEKELNYLKTTREREIAAMIAEARSYGDLSENSEYDAAKNEQAKLYGRIAEIEDVLSHAVIIEDENEASGRVGLGCTVVVEDENGKQTEYRITGSQEANPMENKLSDDSPFGRAIAGKRDRVFIQAHFGAVYDENGHRYFLDSFGTMSAQDTLTPGRTTLTAQELTQLTARIAQTDPVLSNAVVQANQNQEAVIYRQSDLEELFKSLS